TRVAPTRIFQEMRRSKRSIRFRLVTSTSEASSSRRARRRSARLSRSLKNSIWVRGEKPAGGSARSWSARRPSASRTEPSSREALHAVRRAPAEAGRPGRELRPCRGSETDRSDQAGVLEERFHAVGRKRRRSEVGEELQLGIGGLERGQDVVRAVLRHVVVVE